MVSPPTQATVRGCPGIAGFRGALTALFELPFFIADSCFNRSCDRDSKGVCFASPNIDHHRVENVHTDFCLPFFSDFCYTCRWLVADVGCLITEYLSLFQCGNREWSCTSLRRCCALACVRVGTLIASAVLWRLLVQGPMWVLLRGRFFWFNIQWG